VKKEVCDQLISECEQSFQKMGLDFYEVMKKAPEVVERWKKYYAVAQRVWSNSRSRKELTAALLAGRSPKRGPIAPVSLPESSLAHRPLLSLGSGG